jgi:hypothetical protein
MQAQQHQDSAPQQSMFGAKNDEGELLQILFCLHRELQYAGDSLPKQN